MVEFTLPDGLRDQEWKIVIDTKEPRFVETDHIFTDTQAVPVTGRSLVVLRRES
jgi:glycogen operon protein